MLQLLLPAIAQVDLSSGLSSGSSASSFDRLVIHGDKTLLVMFGAPWCSHCKALAVRCPPLSPPCYPARFAILGTLHLYLHPCVRFSFLLLLPRSLSGRSWRSSTRTRLRSSLELWTAQLTHPSATSTPFPAYPRS